MKIRYILSRFQNSRDLKSAKAFRKVKILQHNSLTFRPNDSFLKKDSFAGSLLIIIFLLAASNGFSGEILNVPEVFPTLQDAVNSAVSGDNIILGEGYYYGYTVVDKPVSIVGAGKDKTVLYYNDTTSTQGLSPGILNYAAAAVPVISITTAGKVVIRDIEIRGALKEFLHYGTTTFGIISNNADLELNNITFRRVRNIAVWANRGSLVAADIDFADNMGFKYQADIGFNLTNLTSATILRFNQPYDNIDHSININDYPDGESKETITEVVVKDSTIVSSALFWGDGIRSYGNSNIQVINTKFYRNPGGEPPRNVGNTGISFNGRMSSVRITDSSFKNMVEGIRLMTLPRDDQYYSVTIENSVFDTFDIAPIIITGRGRADLDLGGGALGSGGNNIFMPEGEEIILNKDGADINVSYPGTINPGEGPVENISFEDEIILTESEVQLVNNGKILFKTNISGIKPIKALLSDSYIIASYSYSNGSQYLGIFTKELELISAYNMGTLAIIDFDTDGSVILSHYRNKAGLHYVGTFSLSFEFLGDYWFYSSVKVLKSYLEDGLVKVLYDYGEGAEYIGVFNYQMEYIEEKPVN